MNTKRTREYSFDHVVARARERYDLEILAVDYDIICSRCRNRDRVREIGADDASGDAQEIFILEYGGVKLTAVWSRGRDRVTTLLPP
jgi:hypothetical protein